MTVIFDFADNANRPLAIGWGGRIRTCECRYQKPVPYHLATPQHGQPVKPGGRGAAYSRKAPHEKGSGDAALRGGACFFESRRRDGPAEVKTL